MTVIAVAVPVKAAEPGTVQVVVEIDRGASQLVVPTLTRRLVAIELGDLDVPPAPGLDPPPEHRSLFVRLVGQDELTVRVELWELGEALGAREISFGEGTSEQLRARRIALVAAALGREAAMARRREASYLAEQARLEADAQRAWAASPPDLRTALIAGVRGVVVGTGGLVLGGPRLEGSLRLAAGATLGLGLTSLTGSVPTLAGSPAAEWNELSLAPGWAARFGERARISFAFEVAAATARLLRVRSMDGIEGQSTSWTSRASGRADLELELGRRGSLSLGAAAGMILRPLPVIDRNGNHEEVGGGWLGLDVGWVLDPRRRRATPPPSATEGVAPAAVARGSPTDLPPDSATGSPPPPKWKHPARLPVGLPRPIPAGSSGP
ncbi:MAG: hypothetical protein JW751_06050 [Polyangiaceae bacterium]|nr:hypothetical protein [Polyangiaceae bacterium]